MSPYGTPDELRVAPGPLLRVLQHVSDEIRRYDKQLENLGAEKYPSR